MLLTAAFMAFATFAAKFLALIRDSLMGAYFGTGIETDAFMLASKIPTTLFDVVIGGVISASFIPVFNRILAKEDKREAAEFANKFITLITMASALIALFGIVFSEQLVTLMAKDFSPETHILAVKLSSIMFPMIIFTGIAFSFVGILQSYGEYNIPAVISLISNVAIIGYLVLFGRKFGVTGLSVTMIIAWSLQVMVQIPSLIKFRFRFRPNFRFRDKNIWSAIVLAIPMLVSTWVQPLYTFVNARFASGITGAYSSLEFANRLYLIVTGVFSFVVTNLIFPKLAKANAGDDKEAANALVMMSLKAVIIVIIPLMTGVILLAEPIVEVIYSHGELEGSAGVIANALSCYAAGMVFLAINEVVSKTFFSMQKSVTPMVTAIISMLFDIILVISIYQLIQGDITHLTGGLALAAAGGSMINALLNAFMLFRKNPGMIKKSDVLTLLKVIVSAAVMGAVVYVLYGFAGAKLDGFIGNIIVCAVCGIVGVAVYGAMMLLLKVKEVTQLIPKRNKDSLPERD